MKTKCVPIKERCTRCFEGPVHPQTLLHACAGSTQYSCRKFDGGAMLQLPTLRSCGRFTTSPRAPMSTLSPRGIRYSHVMDVSASGTSWLDDSNSDIWERRVSWTEAVFSPRPASVFLFRCSREKLSGTGWTHAASPQKAVRGDKYRDLHRALTALGFSNSALCAR